MKKAAITVTAAAILIAAAAACTAEGYIGEAKAKEIALTHAGVSQQAAYFTKMEFEQGNGRPEYEIEFFADRVEYDYEIDALTGQVYEYSAKRRGVAWQTDTAPGREISEAEAKRTVLSRVPGATERDIVKFETDYEHGRKVYECDILYDAREYEADIDAATGRIYKYSVKGSPRADRGVTAPAGGISEAEAKRIAISKVPGATEKDIVKFGTDYEHGRKVYECDILYGGRKYDIDVDAATGRIDEYSAKGRHSAAVGDKASAGDISEAEAKKIAISKVPGATEKDIVKFGTDYEHGRKVYECDILYGGRKYDIDVDALTGRIHEYSSEGRHVPPQPAAAPAGGISEADAKKIALSKVPGATERDIVKFGTDYEHGRKVYECDILYGGRKYDIDVDALTGRIDEYSAKGRHSAAAGDKASAGDISAAEAKRIALSKVPGATEKDIVKFGTDYEHGRKVYECDILYGGRKYDIDVDALTGRIHEYSSEGRHVPPQPAKTPGKEISEADAKRIALSKVPGATERDIVKFGTDYEHGRKVYECGILYGGMEYDVDVDAVTGKITKWEIDD